MINLPVIFLLQFSFVPQTIFPLLPSVYSYSTSIDLSSLALLSFLMEIPQVQDEEEKYSAEARLACWR